MCVCVCACLCVYIYLSVYVCVAKSILSLHCVYIIVKVFYIEMVCNDEELIAENIKVIILYNLAII